MVFGKKGSGKTTFLTKMAYKYQKKGRPVYSTEWAPGVNVFDVGKIGYMMFPENSVIFIDEVGMIWDNRNFKQFKPEVRDYFKLQRHYKHTVYLFSQTFDIDLKLRNLTDSMYLLKNHFGWLSVARKIKRSIVLVSPTGESESRIADNLEFEPFLLSLFGANTVIFTFIPHWARLFNSHEAPVLAENESEYIDIPDNPAIKKMYRFKQKGEGSSKGA
jgi:DNA helicase HerA-like ATPase